METLAPCCGAACARSAPLLIIVPSTTDNNDTDQPIEDDEQKLIALSRISYGLAGATLKAYVLATAFLQAIEPSEGAWLLLRSLIRDVAMVV